MLTPASPGYRDRALLRLACWAVRRLRARGPLPVPLLDAAGLVQMIGGDPYLETAAGSTCLRAAWPTRRRRAATPGASPAIGNGARSAGAPDALVPPALTRRCLLGTLRG